MSAAAIVLVLTRNSPGFQISPLSLSLIIAPRPSGFHQTVRRSTPNFLSLRKRRISAVSDERHGAEAQCPQTVSTLGTVAVGLVQRTGHSRGHEYTSGGGAAHN